MYIAISINVKRRKAVQGLHGTIVLLRNVCLVYNNVALELYMERELIETKGLPST